MKEICKFTYINNKILKFRQYYYVTDRNFNNNLNKARFQKTNIIFTS